MPATVSETMAQSNKTEPTPGPWHVELFYGASASPDNFHLCAENGSILEGGLVLESEAENEANASVIGSAWEMRAALQLFIRQWNACGPNSDFGRYFSNVREAARAALRAADGGE